MDGLRSRWVRSEELNELRETLIAWRMTRCVYDGQRFERVDVDDEVCPSCIAAMVPPTATISPQTPQDDSAVPEVAPDLQRTPEAACVRCGTTFGPNDVCTPCWTILENDE